VALPDKWRFRKDLTLQFGLRWEVQDRCDTKGLAAIPDLASIYGPSKAPLAPVAGGNNDPTMEAGRHRSSGCDKLC
jgi:hypothetical protein